MKTKWLINYSYNPTKNNISSHLKSPKWNLDLYTSNFQNILVISDLNISMEDNNMKNVCEKCNLKRLIKGLTCYKNPDKLRCIDLILTGKPKNLQNSCVTETSLSDFHKMTFSN